MLMKEEEALRARWPLMNLGEGQRCGKGQVRPHIFLTEFKPDRWAWSTSAAQPSFFLGRQDTSLCYAWTPTGLIAIQLIALLFM